MIPEEFGDIHQLPSLQSLSSIVSCTVLEARYGDQDPERGNQLNPVLKLLCVVDLEHS